MLKPQENERLTRIGPGTPMGELFRRYWHPIAIEGEMDGRWTERVGLLGENLVLFKDRGGRLGLIEEFCPHRRASLAYGIPTADGIRCPYHGWQFNGSGACIEQPNEPEDSTFREKVCTHGYPVASCGGLIWAYLGPHPAPLVPRLDGFVVEKAIRTVGKAVIPCNWLQIMENSVDSTHAEWLHGHFAEFVSEKEGFKYAASRRTVKIDFEEVELGIRKRRLFEGQTEDADDWKIGHPVIFPNILAIGNAHPMRRQYTFQIRVPVDDTHTKHYWYDALVPPAGSAVQPQLLEKTHAYDVPFLDQHGEFLLNYIYAQDIMVWVQQGAVVDRSREGLGSTDRGITLFRKMLQRELERVAAGEDPKGIIRDPARNAVIDVEIERQMSARGGGFGGMLRRHNISHSPIFDELVKIYDGAPAHLITVQ